MQLRGDKPCKGLRTVEVSSLLVLTGLVFTLSTVAKDRPDTPDVAMESFTLTVQISNFRNDNGRACIAVFDSADDFPSDADNAVCKTISPIRKGKVNVTFTGIKAGTYAVAVFHDEDADGKLGRNWLGIPTEGCGLSRNPSMHFGPPGFNDAKFDVKKSTTVGIRIWQ
jgi:uncharacterized protein (DUF2141 family)